MITLGLVFCDKDYQNCDKLLKQIDERVKVEHEIIVIDNTEGNKLGDKATFAFGYNAYQFAARYKIIKMAKGEYLWFIDGDDDILGLDKIPSDDDVIAFSVNEWYRLENRWYAEGFFDWDFIQNTIKQALWNKLIKRSMFDDIDKYVTDPELKAVTMEDTFYLALALKNAETVHTLPQIIYKHRRGISDALEVTPEQFDSLITGYHDTVKLFGKLGFNEEHIKQCHFRYFSSYIPKCYDSSHVIKRMMELYPDKDIWIERYEDMLKQASDQTEYDNIRSVFIEKFGKESIPMKTCLVGFEDGTEKEIQFEPKIEFSEWKHSVSICGIAYDGNVQYLDKFIKLVKERVYIDYEIIIVDNREDQSKPLKCDAKVIPMGTNKGTVSGRRAGVNAATKDYVWLVDLDDEPLIVRNSFYGETDLIILPVYWESGESERVPIVLPKKMTSLRAFCLYSVCTWNKWIKREVAIAAYDDIPEFFCIYNEDNMLYYALCKHVKTINRANSHPVYAHLVCDNSTTRSMMTTEKQIDKMFIGFDKSIAWQKEYMADHPEISYENPYQITFYLRTLDVYATEEMKPYFANKLISLYGQEAILHAIDVALDDYYESNIIWAKRVLPYFQK